jgi:hypothetical protein
MWVSASAPIIAVCVSQIIVLRMSSSMSFMKPVEILTRMALKR